MRPQDLGYASAGAEAKPARIPEANILNFQRAGVLRKRVEMAFYGYGDSWKFGMHYPEKSG